MNLFQKLIEIQKTVNGLGKDKSTHNYKYVTGEKVLSEIKPLMNSLGLILKQEILSIENTRQDYKTKNGEKSEILSKVMMKFTWVDVDTGEKDENLFGANGQNDWEKGLGSALTYAERYFFLKYFHISTDEDDIDNPERKVEQKVLQNKELLMNEEQKTELIRIASLRHVWSEDESKVILSFASNKNATFDFASKKIKDAHLKIKEREHILQSKSHED